MSAPETLGQYEALFTERMAWADVPDAAEAARRGKLLAHALGAEAMYATETVADVGDNTGPGSTEQYVVRLIAAMLHPERIDGLSARQRRLLLASVQTVTRSVLVEPADVLESLLANDGRFTFDLSVHVA